MNTAPLKADQQAAERVLKAAVRRAADMIRERHRHPRILVIPPTTGPVTFSTGTIFRLPEPESAPDPVVAMLTAAGESAALLLDKRPAKKAAARKGAS